MMPKETIVACSVAVLGNKLWFEDIMRKHNAEGDEFHFFNPHAVVCIGNVSEADCWPRANTLCGDGTARFSKSEQEAILVGICEH
jgi:hypothetical protein